MKKIIFILTILLTVSFSAFAQNKQDLVKLDEDQGFLILSTKKIQTLEKELDEVAAKGYRVLYAAPTQQFDLGIFLSKVEQNQEAFTYKILATSRNKTMEKELNEFGEKGYRLLPRTIVFKQGFFTAELAMIMEREAKPQKYVYKLVEDFKETKLHKKIEEKMKEGYQPITMITLGNHVIVMEKEVKE